MRIPLRTLLIFISLALLSGCAHRFSAAPFGECLHFVVASDSSQAVVVSRQKDAPAHRVRMEILERRESGWEAVHSMEGVAGRRGFAPLGEKREGDGCTPSGVFPITRGFGYSPLETRLPYIVLTPDMIWVDDPASPDYNRLVSLDRVRAGSFETMRRRDDLYKYGAVVEYNTDPVVSGLGSAIFFHVRRSPDSPTAGCVAVSEEDMVRILRWLDPARKPVAVLGADGVCGCLR